MYSGRKELAALIAACLLPAIAIGCGSTQSPAAWDTEWVPPEPEGADTVWEEISSAEVPPAETEQGLKDLVGLALKQNPSTRQAWASARAAEASVGEARAAWYPWLTVSADGTYQREDYTVKDPAAAVLGQDIDQYTYGPGAQLTWLLLDLGGRGARIDQALQLLLAADYQFNQALQNLLLSVEQAYFNYDAAVSTEAAAQADLDDARTSLEAARDRVQAGLASKLEELQAESNYYNALYALEDSRGTVKDALGTVAQTVGVKADTPLAVALPQGEPPLDLPREEVGKMIDAAIAQRPDIAARRAQVGSLAAAVSAADSDLWPTLNLGGNAAGTWYSYNGDFEPYDRSWNLVGFLQINWDIFSGFSDRSAKLAAQADLESALQGLRQAELAASADVWTAYNNFGTAVEKYKAGKALFASAQASYDYALDSYKAGLDSILDLLQAQSQLSTARSKLVASRRDVHLAIAGLAYSTGSLTVASYKDETLNQ